MFLLSVCKLTHFEIIGTITKPVGTAMQQPTKKSLSQSLKKLSQYPECTNNIPPVITIVIATETEILEKNCACDFVKCIINCEIKKSAKVLGSQTV